jgi:alpha-glucoside transport system permease protein
MKTKPWVPWLYLLPALALLIFYLFYPMVRTIYISFFDRFSEQFVGWDNYEFVFGNTLQSALFNNFLWLTVFVGVVIFLGLMLSVLLDRVPYEKYAKAFIFMPMGISAVGAGIIWKFVYAYQPPGRDQLGLLNAALVSLGEWAMNPFVNQALTAFLYLFIAVAALSLGLVIIRKSWKFLSVFAISILIMLFIQFLLNNAGTDPVAWLLDRSINNYAIIAVGVWIWTGFALVFLSASYKGLPKELTEAARLDGANAWQVFLLIHLPMLAVPITTITVTMVVFSLKVFDEVYVMTAGNFGTQILANRMFQEIFQFSDSGRASAIAVVLLVATVPAILFNLWSYKRRGVL